MHPKRELLPQLILCFLSSDGVIFALSPAIPPHQTLSIMSAEVRKSTYISILPAVTYWNNSEATKNPSFICQDICSQLIFNFLKNFLVSQDIGLWSQ